MAPISIQLQNNDEKPIPVELPSYCSFDDFKAILQNIYGPTYWKYSFICHGKSFDGNKEEDFNQMKTLLIPGMTLFSEIRTRGAGGSVFVDVTQTENIRRIKFSKTAPVWRMAMPGLCLEGLCSNAKCEAYQQLVIANVGIRKFDLNVEKAEFSKCPRCQEYVQLVTCGFNNCRWRYYGQIERGHQRPMKVDGDWSTAKDDYFRFDDKTSGTATWLQLIFEVESLK